MRYDRTTGTTKFVCLKKGSTNIRKLVSANTLYRGSPAVLEALYSERIEFRMYYYYMYDMKYSMQCTTIIQTPYKVYTWQTAVLYKYNND